MYELEVTHEEVPFVISLTLVLALLLGAVGVAGQDQFAGVKITVLTFDGPQVAEPLQRHAPEFQALTGQEVTVVTVPFADLYQTILTRPGDWHLQL